FSSRRRHTRSKRDWSSDVCSSDLRGRAGGAYGNVGGPWQGIGVASPRRRSAGPTWRDVPLAPVVLVRGAEPLLADRTLQRIADLAREHAGGSEAIAQTVLEAATYEKGTLEVLASRSLFGEHRHVVVQGAEGASDTFIEDALQFVAEAGSQVGDVTLVVRHEKGTRGKKLLDAIAKSG